MVKWDSPNGDYRGLGIILALHIDGDDEVHSLSILGPDGLQDVDGYEIDWEHLAQDFGYVGYHNPSSPPSLPLFETLGLGLPKKAADDEDDPNVYETVNLKRHGTQSERETAAEIDKVIFEITKVSKSRSEPAFLPMTHTRILSNGGKDRTSSRRWTEN